MQIQEPSKIRLKSPCNNNFFLFFSFLAPGTEKNMCCLNMVVLLIYHLSVFQHLPNTESIIYKREGWAGLGETQDLQTFFIFQLEKPKPYQGDSPTTTL